MIIGFDGSRAFINERTGTENYSYKLIEALGKIDKKNNYLLYTRGNFSDNDKKKFGNISNISFKSISWKKLWTQGGLALQTWRDNLDLLFVPAHTLPVLRKPGLATVVTIHGMEYEYLPEYYEFPQKLYVNWSTEYAVRNAEKIISVSEFTKREMVKRLRADPEKIQVIHEGVDILVYSKAYSDNLKHSNLERLGINKPYILFVGVVQPRKNLVRLIEAFSLLIRQKQLRLKIVNTDRRSSARISDWRNFSLVIAGKKGWMCEEIYEAPEKFGIEDRVKFIGFVSEEDLPILYQEALVYIQPSLTEGFGLPVLEAMAARTPVIAANSGALPEVAGNAGLLIDPNSSVNIAEGIELVIKNEEFREELRQKGLKRVKNFTWKKTAINTVKLFEKIISDKKR